MIVFYGFRKCAHLCICEECFKSPDSDKLTNCVVCKS